MEMLQGGGSARKGSSSMRGPARGGREAELDNMLASVLGGMMDGQGGDSRACAILARYRQLRQRPVELEPVSRVCYRPHDADIVALPVILVRCVSHPTVCHKHPAMQAVEGCVVRHEQLVRQPDLCESEVWRREQLGVFLGGA